MLKLDRFEITDLFGRKGFSHTIDFNHDPGMTIIVGENGFGKTTILKMINGLLTFDFSVFFTVSYSSVKFYFTDTNKNVSILEISKTKRKSETIHKIAFDQRIAEGQQIDELDLSRNLKLKSFLIQNLFEEDDDFFLFPSRRARLIEGFPQENLYKLLYDIISGRKTVVSNDRIEDVFSVSTLQPILNKLNYLRENLHILFINTDRLKYSNDKDEPYRSRSSQKTLMVEHINDDLKKQFNDVLVKAAQIAQESDSSFPNRIIQGLNRHKEVLDLEKLYADLKLIKQRREKLISFGLLDKFSQDIDLNPANVGTDEQEYVKVVLSEYIKDSDKKIKDLEVVAKKVELLQSIINKRFTFKTMKVTKTGMHFFPEGNFEGNNDEIPLNSLSSGEQHELILFYRLLFQVEPESLVLIDEPEISLHAAWQTYFVQDVIEIAQKNRFDIAIATHSPLVIQDHLYLATKLSGIEQ